MHSVSTSCTCHRCGALLYRHHGSHHRTVQDLPILGKQVILDMQIYDYECDSETCKPFAPTETFDGFLNYNSRMTNRLEDFACVLAIETSCESSARIMKSMNIKISANVKHFFTLLGKMFFTSYGKEFFTYPGKQIFTLYGKYFFT